MARIIIGAVFFASIVYVCGFMDGFDRGKRMGVEATIAEFDRQLATR